MDVTIRLTVTHNHLPHLVDGLGRLGRDWADEVADLQVIHHQEEAPVGREFYMDAEGHQHPGWLRDSADKVELPDGSWLVTVHAFYGIYVNNGTRHMAPNPFWERATLRTERGADDILDRRTNELMAEVAL